MPVTNNQLLGDLYPWQCRLYVPGQELLHRCMMSNDEMFDNELFKSLPQAQDLREYVEDGRPTNHFLTALLRNDLMSCIGRADVRNKAALEDYVIWLQSYAPGHCHGGRKQVAAWIAHRGMRCEERA
jgi:hypothetical protein